jgi:hypothetical protein
MSPEAKRIWRELLEVEALAVQERLLYLGLTASPDSPRLLDVAWKAAADAQDRASGKATEHHDVRTRTTVIFGQLDPTLLPSAPPSTHSQRRDDLMMPSDLPRFRKQRERENGQSRERYNGYLADHTEPASKEVTLPQVPIEDLPRQEPLREKDLPRG